MKKIDAPLKIHARGDEKFKIFLHGRILEVQLYRTKSLWQPASPDLGECHKMPFSLRNCDTCVLLIRGSSFFQLGTRSENFLRGLKFFE